MRAMRTQGRRRGLWPCVFGVHTVGANGRLVRSARPCISLFLLSVLAQCASLWRGDNDCVVVALVLALVTRSRDASIWTWITELTAALWHLLCGLVLASVCASKAFASSASLPTRREWSLTHTHSASLLIRFDVMARRIAASEADTHREPPCAMDGRRRVESSRVASLQSIDAAVVAHTQTKRQRGLIRFTCTRFTHARAIGCMEHCTTCYSLTDWLFMINATHIHAPPRGTDGASPLTWPLTEKRHGCVVASGAPRSPATSPLLPLPLLLCGVMSTLMLPSRL